MVDHLESCRSLTVEPPGEVIHYDTTTSRICQEINYQCAQRLTMAYNA